VSVCNVLAVESLDLERSFWCANTSSELSIPGRIQGHKVRVKVTMVTGAKSVLGWSAFD